MAKKIELTTEEQKLYNELRKLAKRANQRILQIERKYGYGTWGIRKLYEMLDTEKYQAISSKGRIKVSKQYNEMQLKAIIKATKDFLGRKNLSTISGIKKTIQQQKKNFRGQIDEMTDEESEVFYQSLSDTDITWLLKYMTPSELEIVEWEAKKKPDELSEWLDRVEYAVDWQNDLEAKERLITIWNKYIRR